VAYYAAMRGCPASKNGPVSKRLMGYAAPQAVPSSIANGHQAIRGRGRNWRTCSRGFPPGCAVKSLDNPELVELDGHKFRNSTYEFLSVAFDERLLNRSAVSSQGQSNRQLGRYRDVRNTQRIALTQDILFECACLARLRLRRTCGSLDPRLADRRRSFLFERDGAQVEPFFFVSARMIPKD
jgi:hypothetical protein